MRACYKKSLGLIVISGFLLLALFHVWSPGTISGVDIRPRQGSAIEKLLEWKFQDAVSDYHDIAYHINEDVAWCVISQVILSKFCSESLFLSVSQQTVVPFFSLYSRLAKNTCVCLADKTYQLPFSNLLLPHVWAHNIDLAFLESHPDPEGVKRHRAQEYSSFQKR